MTAPAVRRPVLRYHGGKWRLAPWIISFFPVHTLYVEPFGGGGSVLMRKPKSPGEVYNDLDDELANVFRMLQDPATAAELERLITLTPYARSEFELAYQPAADPIERARRLLIRAWMGHGGVGTRRHRNGMRPVKGTRGRRPSDDWANYPAQISSFVERLRHVWLEQRDAFTVIERLDGADTLFYLDPPYPHSTRTSLSNGHKQHYHHEMSDDDHRSLAAVVHRLKGLVVLSGYRCPLYDEELYRDWQSFEKHAVADGGKARTEVVYLNPRCAAAQLAELES